MQNRAIEKRGFNYVGFSRGLLFLALGVYLIGWPERALDTLLNLLGILLLISGAFSFIMSYRNKTVSDLGTRRMLVFSGFVFMILGILLFVFSTFFASIVMIVLGILLLLSALFQFSDLWRASRFYGFKIPWFAYVDPVILILLAIIILSNPFHSAGAIAVFAGIVCVVSALFDFWNLISIGRRSE